MMGLVTVIGKASIDSPKLAMEKVANDCGVPFLMSIPQTPDVGLLKPYCQNNPTGLCLSLCLIWGKRVET
jgi:hypothetical protein